MVDVERRHAAEPASELVTPSEHEAAVGQQQVAAGVLPPVAEQRATEPAAPSASEQAFGANAAHEEPLAHVSSTQTEAGTIHHHAHAVTVMELNSEYWNPKASHRDANPAVHKKHTFPNEPDDHAHHAPVGGYHYMNIEKTAHIVHAHAPTIVLVEDMDAFYLHHGNTAHAAGLAKLLHDYKIIFHGRTGIMVRKDAGVHVEHVHALSKNQLFAKVTVAGKRFLLGVGQFLSGKTNHPRHAREANAVMNYIKRNHAGRNVIYGADFNERKHHDPSRDEAGYRTMRGRAGDVFRSPAQRDAWQHFQANTDTLGLYSTAALAQTPGGMVHTGPASPGVAYPHRHIHDEHVTEMATTDIMIE